MESMLELNMYIVAVKAIHGLAADYVFHRLAGNTGTKRHSIITGYLLSPFSEAAMTLACCLNYYELVLLLCFVAEITVV